MQPSVQRFLRTGIPLFCSGLILYLCLYKVGNTDFWWHIKAGQLIRETGELIATDPFSYIREGAPYLALHPWLSQIVLSFFYDIGGAYGIILLRITLLFATLIALLKIDRTHAWINSILAVIVAVSIRPALTDRPQLFTLFAFAFFVSLCFQYFDGNLKRRNRILTTLIPLELLWANLHGAAAVIGILVFGALGVERLANKADRHELVNLICIGFGLLIMLLVTPKGLGNIGYLIQLTTDNTTQFIREWQPSSWKLYLIHVSPLLAPAVISLYFHRKQWIFSLLLLLGIGVLSRTAARHESLLILAAAAVTIYQLKHSDVLERFLKKSFAFPVLIIVLLVLTRYTHIRSYDINRINHLFGIGIFQPVAGAAEYLDEENVTGNMFNNYNAGGELLFHDRKVFIDGRNVDYGFDHMNTTIHAGVDREVWKDLDTVYNFTHSVIYYDIQAELSPLPYTDLLDTDPDWNLVYLDDWSAVYRKGLFDGAYVHLTPKKLHTMWIPEEITLGDLKALEQELLRVIDARSDGIKGHLHLARLYTSIGFYDQAETLLSEAMQRQHNAYQIYQLWSKLYSEQEQWSEALVMIERAIQKAGYSATQLNQEKLKEIRGKAE